MSVDGDKDQPEPKTGIPKADIVMPNLDDVPKDHVMIRKNAETGGLQVGYGHD